jgi:DnaJ-class molecular chaperone
MTLEEIADDIKKELPFVCLKCEGSGKYKQENELILFQFQSIHINAEKDCNICNSEGYTQHKKRTFVENS